MILGRVRMAMMKVMTQTELSATDIEEPDKNDIHGMTARISGMSMQALCCLSPLFPLGGYRYSLHRTRNLNTSELRYKNVSSSQNVYSPVGNLS